MQPLQDRFGRRFEYLRLSITDVCNFKCQYCLPNGYLPNGKTKFLQLDEIQRILSAFSAAGTKKVRITGGEPSMRRDFEQIISLTAETPGIEKVAITTNAYRLAEHARSWRKAGLNQINISLDSLDADEFYRITGDSRFDLVMRGIDASLSEGYDSVKANVVLLKGQNDHQLPQFLEFIRHRKMDFRFIELMETGLQREYFQKHHVSGVSIQNQLIAGGWIPEIRRSTDGPAVNYSHPDYAGRIGLIMPYAKNFCANCNRLRVSSLGKLYMCLFAEQSIDLRDLLERDDQQIELLTRMSTALGDKHETHYLQEGNTGITPHFASIGG